MKQEKFQNNSQKQKINKKGKFSRVIVLLIAILALAGSFIFTVQNKQPAQAAVHLFRETFGTGTSGNNLMPTALSNADTPWNESPSCFNNLRGDLGPSGDSPEDGASNIALLNSTGFCALTGTERVWYMINPVSVDPGKRYVFSYWTRLYTDSNQPDLNVSFVSNGTVTTHGQTTPAYPPSGDPNPWIKRTVTFATTGTNVQVEMRNAQTNVGGNDFYLDDLKITELPSIRLTTTTINGLAGGPFDYTLTNTAQASGTATTTASGSPAVVDGDTTTTTTDFQASVENVAIQITQASLPAGWSLDDASCTLEGSPVGSLSGSAYTIPAPNIILGNHFECNFTNTPDAATLTLTKTTEGSAGGPFNFTLTNTTQVSGTVTTNATATPTQVDGDTGLAGTQSFAISNFATNVTITESALPASWSMSSFSCTSGGNPIGNLSGLTYTIPAVAIDTPNEAFICNVTNTQDVDFSDGPSGFGAASHTSQAGLLLGPGVTFETVDLASPNADVDTDDSLVSTPAIAANAPNALVVAATNTTSQDATLAGWIDLNNNGIYETLERVSVAVPANSGTADYTLTFPAGTTTNDTFARFRLFAGTLADPSPAGQVAGGEVEDYAIQIANYTVDKTSDLAEGNSVDSGAVITYTLTIENTGIIPIPVSDIVLIDDLSNVFDDATLETSPVVAPASSGTAEVNGSNLTFTGIVPQGTPTTITYSVRVKLVSQLGDASIVNTVSADRTACAITNPDCATLHAVNVPISGDLADTGMSIVTVVALATASLVGSIGLMLKKGRHHIS